MTTTISTARNASLPDLVEILRAKHTLKLDVVANSLAIVPRRDGLLDVEYPEPILLDDGLLTRGTYRPTAIFDEGLAEKLGIPVAYLKRLRATRPDLWAANVAGWLHGWPGTTSDLGTVAGADPDPRQQLLRLFRPATLDDSVGVARAFLSDTYKVMDDLDVLTAALDAVKESGVNVEIVGCDLSDRRMSVKVAAPEIYAYADTLLRDYRNPFSRGARRAGDGSGPFPTDGSGRPIVFAGFVLSNSEVGGGAASLTPRLTIEICSNGMTVNRDIVRAVHLGRRLGSGVVQWSDETQQRNLDLVASMTKDAVRTFLNVDYVTAKVAEIESNGRKPIVVEAQVRHVANTLAFTEDQTTALVNHFMLGGQMTAMGVANAVTSVAQTIADPDVANELEGRAFEAIEVAANVSGSLVDA